MYLDTIHRIKNRSNEFSLKYGIFVVVCVTIATRLNILNLLFLLVEHIYTINLSYHQGMTQDLSPLYRCTDENEEFSSNQLCFWPKLAFFLQISYIFTMGVQTRIQSCVIPWLSHLSLSYVSMKWEGEVSRWAFSSPLFELTNNHWSTL